MTPVKWKKTATKRRIVMMTKMRSYRENWRECGESVRKRRRKRYVSHALRFKQSGGLFMLITTFWGDYRKKSDQEKSKKPESETLRSAIPSSTSKTSP